MSEELIVHSKTQERGRRRIADMLAGWSDLINSLVNQDLEAGLERDPLNCFWINPQSDWDSMVIHRLGAMVYAPFIIKVVTGEQVRVIAETLGRNVYADTLRFGRANLDQLLDASTDELKLIKIGMDNEWLLELQLEGFNELSGFAFRRHPLLLERVKITQDKSLSVCTPLHFKKSRLKDKWVEECILEVMKVSPDE